MNPNQEPNQVNPELLKIQINLLEAEIAIHQSWVDSVLILGKTQYAYDIEEAESKQASNRTAKLPGLLFALAEARLAERQCNAGLTQLHVNKMKGQRDTLKAMLEKAEKKVQLVPGSAI